MFKKLIAGVALAGALAGLGISSNTNAASASATGCTRFGSVNQNAFCLYTSGSGTYLSYDRANFTMVGTMCNYFFRFTLYDTSGNLYYTYTFPTHVGCNVSATYQLNFNQTVRAGKTCASVYSNGSLQTKACNSIY